VHDDDDGLAALRALGARSVPVLAQGSRFVFAQSLREVATFLGLEDIGGPALSPAALVERLDLVLAAAVRFLHQLPEARLGDKLPGRDRSYRELLHHIFRIPEAFLEAVEGGALTHESLVVAPGPEQQDIDGLAGYGRGVRARVAAWGNGIEGCDAEVRLPTYYGEQPLHEVLERTTWHAAQHVRQVMMVLDGLDIAPERPLTAADLAGLPLPEQVWDG
jgi:hypothetical protein